MSGGHARVAGKLFRKVTLGGKEYTVRPMKVGILAEMEAYVISLREDPLKMAVRACQQAPQAMHESIWRVALDRSCAARVVSAEELSAFEQSLQGYAWKLWISLRGDHPEFKDPNDVLPLLEHAGRQAVEQIMADVHAVSGEDELGNSFGGNPDQEVERPAGPPSTDPLPSATDGPPTK